MFKSFHPRALNASFFLLEHQWAFEPSVIVAYKSLSCPQCEKMDLKIIVIVGKGSNTQKCWKTKDVVGPEDFYEEQQVV